MAAIQVKNVPDDIHDALRARARAEGKTVGEVILEAVRRELRAQEMRAWVDHVQEVTKSFPKLTREQVQEIVRESRTDRRWDDAP